jgi:tRNA threonylcarbamoyladenosine biosynthesis protein TsaE
VFVVESKNPEQTVDLGECLGKLILPGDFIALTGELGCGKTHFVQGVAKGLGVDPEVRVTSPSYTLLNEYHGRIPLYHFDLYRLGGDADIRDLGFDEYFSGKGVCVVEWADRLHFELPDDHLRISFFQTGEWCRRIEISAGGPRSQGLLHDLLRICDKGN